MHCKQNKGAGKKQPSGTERAQSKASHERRMQQLCFLGDVLILQTWEPNKNSMFPGVPLSHSMQSLPLGILFRNLLFYIVIFSLLLRVFSEDMSVAEAHAAVCRATAQGMSLP